MKTSEEIKQMVREKYSEVASQDKTTNQSSCCGTSCCSTDVYNIMSDDYSKLEGYNPDADLGLGCGLPTEFAKMKKGDTVVDLGSGAGNDCSQCSPSLQLGPVGGHSAPSSVRSMGASPFGELSRGLRPLEPHRAGCLHYFIRGLWRCGLSRLLVLGSSPETLVR